MNNENIKLAALRLLEGVNTKVIESIEIDNTNYEDGTSTLTITVGYPARGGENEDAK